MKKNLMKNILPCEKFLSETICMVVTNRIRNKNNRCIKKPKFSVELNFILYR